jgi:hypothetical protein
MNYINERLQEINLKIYSHLGVVRLILECREIALSSTLELSSFLEQHPKVEMSVRVRGKAFDSHAI